ncbi:MAG TPA: hypothetical protein VI006_13895, partial [Solirubrobacteraceae bacterium]
MFTGTSTVDSTRPWSGPAVERWSSMQSATHGLDGDEHAHEPRIAPERADCEGRRVAAAPRARRQWPSSNRCRAATAVPAKSEK